MFAFALPNPVKARTTKCTCGNDSCKKAKKIRCVCQGCHGASHGSANREHMPNLDMCRDLSGILAPERCDRIGGQVKIYEACTRKQL